MSCELIPGTEHVTRISDWMPSGRGPEAYGPEDDYPGIRREFERRDDGWYTRLIAFSARYRLTVDYAQ